MATGNLFAQLTIETCNSSCIWFVMSDKIETHIVELWITNIIYSGSGLVF